MAQFDLFRLAMVGIGLAATTLPARADMQVLDSNVARYPRDMRVKGNAITDLGPREWVRVRMLDDNSTQEFGTRPPQSPGLGTRGLRRAPD